MEMGMEESILDIIQSIQELKKTVSDLKKGQSGHMIQSGFWEILDPDAMQKLSKKVRTFSDREVKKEIVFDRPFMKTPKIHCGLTHIDTDSSVNSTRVRAVAENIRKDGFTLKINTWRISRIFGFRIEWLAYTN